MATIDIGKLTFTHKGDYAGGTAYVANDVVYYNGSAYIAKTSTTGNLPTSTAHWSTFASGSGGIWNSGLSLGSANQVVAVNSSANALEFQDASAGVFSQYKIRRNQSDYSNSNQSSDVTATNHYVDITPTTTSKKIMLRYTIPLRLQSGGPDCGFKYTILRTVGGSTTEIYSGGNTQFYYYDNGGSTNNRYNTNIIYVDSPNTTSSVRYGYKFRNPHSTAVVEVNDDTSNDYTQIEAFETDENYQ